MRKEIVKYNVRILCSKFSEYIFLIFKQSNHIILMSDFEPLFFSQTNTKSSLHTGNIIIQGSLYIKRPPPHGLLRLKAWQKRYFVLIGEILDTSADHPRLEMYRDESDLLNQQQERYVLPLTNVTYVGLSGESKRFRHVFSIVCAGCLPILLAGLSESYVSEWVIALKLITGTTITAPPLTPGLVSSESGILDIDHLSIGSKKASLDKNDSSEHSAGSYCSEIKEMGRDYDITVVPTDVSLRNHIFGDYVLQVSSRGVCLYTKDNNEVAYWPLCYIRKFESQRLKGSDNKFTLVTLEIGRRCVTGEGIFQFKSCKGRELVRDIKDTALTATARRQLTSRLLRSDGSDGSTSSSRSTPSTTRRRNPAFRSLTALMSDHSESSFSVNTINSSSNPETEENYVPQDYIQPNVFLDQFPVGSSKDHDLTSSCSTGSGSTLSGQGDYIMLLGENETSQDRNFFTNEQKLQSKINTCESEAYIEILPAALTIKQSEEKIHQNLSSPISKEAPSFDKLKRSDSVRSRKDTGVSLRSNPIRSHSRESSYPPSAKVTRSSKPPLPLPRPHHTITAQSSLIHSRTSSVSSQSESTKSRSNFADDSQTIPDKKRTSSEKEKLRMNTWQKSTGPPILSPKLKPTLSSNLSL